MQARASAWLQGKSKRILGKSEIKWNSQVKNITNNNTKKLIFFSSYIKIDSQQLILQLPIDPNKFKRFYKIQNRYIGPRETVLSPIPKYTICCTLALYGYYAIFCEGRVLGSLFCRINPIWFQNIKCKIGLF
jgi:hypothetical protein